MKPEPRPSALWPLVLRELWAYFNTPAAYIVIVVFLLITGYLFGKPLFLINQSSLDPFTDLAPLLLTFFVPAITMRHLAEEVKSGTIEVLMTLPVRDGEILASKFLATLALIAATLALTFAYPLVLFLLGKPDPGAVAGAYLGLLLTGGLLAALGLFASSLTRNQVVAFIIGFLFCFTLYIAGKLGAFMTGFAAPVADYLGLDSHLAGVSRGVLDTRDLVYYASGISFCLFLCQVRLWLRRSTKRWLSSGAGVALAAGVLAAVNVLSRYAYARLDLSAGRLYSMSRASKDILAALPDPVLVDVYHSRDLPAPVGVHLRYLRDLLAEYRSGSKGKVRPRFVEVGEAAASREEAARAGVAPVRFDTYARDRYEQREGFLGVVLRYQDKKETIPFLQDTENLEYELTSRIQALSRKSKPALGFVTSAGSQGAESMHPEVREKLESRFDLTPVDLASVSTASGVPANVSVLAILGPQGRFSDREVYALDQYLLSGRSLFVAADAKRVDMRSFFASDKPTGLEGFLKHHGLALRTALVMDLLNQPIQVQVQEGPYIMAHVVEYPPIVRVMDVSATHPATKELQAMVLPFASPIDVSTRGVSGRVDVLARSSRASWYKGGPESQFLRVDPFAESRPGDADPKGPFVLAAAVTDEFKPFMPQPPAGGLTRAARAGRLAVIGTSRFLSREFRPPVTNYLFFLNMADWLSQDSALISIRAKGAAFRPLAAVSPGLKALARWVIVLAPSMLAVGLGLGRWQALRRSRARRRELYGNPEREPAAAGA